jgi:putative endonuclease
MFYTYILRSLTRKRYYIGSTKNLINRLKEHNFGEVQSTRYYIPWEIVHTEEFNTVSEARKREFYIKSQKSRKSIENLIEKSGRGSAGRALG